MGDAEHEPSEQQPAMPLIFGTDYARHDACFKRDADLRQAVTRMRAEIDRMVEVACYGGMPALRKALGSPLSDDPAPGTALAARAGRPTTAGGTKDSPWFPGLGPVFGLDAPDHGAFEYRDGRAVEVPCQCDICQKWRQAHPTA